MPRSYRLTMAALTVALAFAGPALAAEPIPIGWVGPLSPPGGYSAGQEMKWAAQLATEEVNKAGGVLGRPIEVTYEDTKGTPDQGTAAMERLINDDHVVAVFGEFHSSVALAEIAVAHKYGIPWVGTDVWADSITAKQYPEVFRVSPANSLIYTIVGDWVTKAGFKNVAIMQEATDYGVGAVQVLKGILDKKNIKTNVITVQLNQQDFTPEILRLMNRKPRPDILMVIVAGEALYPIIKQACNQGFAPTAQTALYSGGGGALEKEVWETTGECANYLIAEDVALPSSQWNQKAKDFVAAFERKFNRAPTGTAMESYDDLHIIAQAIRQAGSTDSKAIIKALENIKYTGTRGAYHFSTKKDPAWAYHQFMKAPIMLIQYDQESQSPDKAPIIYPRKWATIKQLYLKPAE
jgi:branched-chain amino acid transport system substrate-binding protein